MPSAKQVYSIRKGCVLALGVQFDAEGVTQISTPVQALLVDQAGVDQVQEAMSGVTLTDFEADRLASLLNSARPQEEWRVGEALAEYHLAEEHSCTFPWPSGRDLKNPGTSSGGVDLVGFHHHAGSVRLAFAEVKTSRHEATPPSVMTGRHGMQEQLSGLRDNDSRLQWAIKYLAFHMPGKVWMSDCQSSLTRYLRNSRDISLFGALIRPLSPNQRDLATRCESLAGGAHSPISIHLLAIYIPRDGLEGLAGTRVTVETGA